MRTIMFVVGAFALGIVAYAKNLMGVADKVDEVLNSVPSIDKTDEED